MFCLVFEKQSGNVTENFEFTKGMSMIDYILNVIENIDDYNGYEIVSYGRYSDHDYYLEYDGEYVAAYFVNDTSIIMGFYPNVFMIDGVYDEDNFEERGMDDPIIGSNKGCYYKRWGN